MLRSGLAAALVVVLLLGLTSCRRRHSPRANAEFSSRSSERCGDLALDSAAGGAGGSGRTDAIVGGATNSLPVSPERNKLPLRSRPVKIEGKRGVVVEGGNAWVPSAAVLSRLEQGFPDKLGKNAERGRRVDGYFRQYWGQVSDGERIVEVELFREPPRGIESAPVMVFDGGPTHATTWYNPERDVFLGFMGGP